MNDDRKPYRIIRIVHLRQADFLEAAFEDACQLIQRVGVMRHEQREVFQEGDLLTRAFARHPPRHRRYFWRGCRVLEREHRPGLLCSQWITLLIARL